MKKKEFILIIFLSDEINTKKNSRKKKEEMECFQIEYKNIKSKISEEKFEDDDYKY